MNKSQKQIAKAIERARTFLDQCPDSHWSNDNEIADVHALINDLDAALVLAKAEVEHFVITSLNGHFVVCEMQRFPSFEMAKSYAENHNDTKTIIARTVLRGMPRRTMEWHDE